MPLCSLLYFPAHSPIRRKRKRQVALAAPRCRAKKKAEAAEERTRAEADAEAAFGNRIRTSFFHQIRLAVSNCLSVLIENQVYDLRLISATDTVPR